MSSVSADSEKPQLSQCEDVLSQLWQKSEALMLLVFTGANWEPRK